MARILVVDDEEGIRSFLSEALELDGYDTATASNVDEALRALKTQSFALVLTDLKMPGRTGMELLREIKQEQPEIEVIVLTAHGTIDTAVEAMKLGAFEYLQKPVSSPRELRLLVARALEHHSLVANQERAKLDAPADPPLTYGAPTMEPVLEALQKVARTNATVLLTGESGCGKEVAARKVHQWSERAKGPFVAINCAALSESLLESELFGHEKGAFTGAFSRRRGRIELAEGGTFFLDEIGEMKLELQAKLLRVLQEKVFERVGGTQTIQADVRWIAATNRDLPTFVKEGNFREDLYHRLAVFPVELPPLRKRKEDIVPLAETLLLRVGAELGRSGLRLDPKAQELIAQWDWPGNVRALANALERAAILADGTTLEPKHFTPPAATSTPAPADDGEVKSLAEVERAAIIRALDEVEGNRRKASELLGIGLRTLYDKLKKYDIQ